MVVTGLSNGQVPLCHLSTLNSQDSAAFQKQEQYPQHVLPSDVTLVHNPENPEH